MVAAMVAAVGAVSIAVWALEVTVFEKLLLREGYYLFCYLLSFLL